MVFKVSQYPNDVYINTFVPKKIEKFPNLLTKTVALTIDNLVDKRQNN